MFLQESFLNVIHAVGMSELRHPIFYHSSVGIRFEIGGDEDVYLEAGCTENHIMNPAYISAAFNRATEIYKNLPHKPNLLRIDIYPNECDAQKEIKLICKSADIPIPQQQIPVSFRWAEDDDPVTQLQLYWDLENTPFTPERLLKEIIKADIGGYSGFTSNVYFADTHHSVLFHLYDDRGADLVAANEELLRPLYEKFNDWILDYDREKINAIFAK